MQLSYVDTRSIIKWVNKFEESFKYDFITKSQMYYIVANRELSYMKIYQSVKQFSQQNLTHDTHKDQKETLSCLRTLDQPSRNDMRLPVRI